jgi:N-acetylmuramoyl-L-alanine amidase
VEEVPEKRLGADGMGGVCLAANLLRHRVLVRKLTWAVSTLAIALTACGAAASASGAAAPASGTVPPPVSSASTRTVPAARSDQAAPSAAHASPHGGPARFPPTAKGILDGNVIVIDPGHNGGNAGAPAVIGKLVWNGRETEACDTAGAQTASGYPEALFNWNVARYLMADLRAAGATVVLTRTTNTGVGPCITERAAIGNHAHAGAAVSIHADGGPPNGRGVAILVPVADGINNAIIAPSARLATDLRSAFTARTGEPVSSYDGINGIQPRDDLAGTNLSTVPKVFIECANMRNARDAALVTSSGWQAKAARAIAAGLIAFLEPVPARHGRGS